MLFDAPVFLMTMFNGELKSIVIIAVKKKKL
jgi:hypothetical protein